VFTDTRVNTATQVLLVPSANRPGEHRHRFWPDRHRLSWI